MPKLHFLIQDKLFIGKNKAFKITKWCIIENSSDNNK